MFGGYLPRPQYNYTRAAYPQIMDAVPVTWPVDVPPPRCNFDALSEALLCIFTLLSGEGWNDVMFDQYRATRAVYGAVSQRDASPHAAWLLL